VKIVYKYPVPLVDIFMLSLPEGAEILHVAEQAPRQPFMWVLVETTAPVQLRTFRLAGTGHSIFQPVARRHVATFFLDGASLVFHLFDVTPNVEESR